MEDFSMMFLQFCISFVFDYLFRTFVLQTLLEDRELLPWEKRAYLFPDLDNKDNGSFCGKVWAGFLRAHLKRLKLPKLWVLQLWHKPTACAAYSCVLLYITPLGPGKEGKWRKWEAPSAWSHNPVFYLSLGSPLSPASF